MSELKDKDKLIIGVMCKIEYSTSFQTQQKNVERINEFTEYITNMFDESVKVIVFPTYEKYEKPIFVINRPATCTCECIKKINEDNCKKIDNYSEPPSLEQCIDELFDYMM